MNCSPHYSPRINSSKKSVTESTVLFQCFPTLGTFVLELTPVKQWHALDIVNHIPADQCLMALGPKVTELKDAPEVSM